MNNVGVARHGLLHAIVLGLALLCTGNLQALEQAGVEPFPGSDRAGGSSDRQPANHEFVLGGVERAQGQVRVAASERVRGTRTTAVYAAPRGTSLDETVAHYQDQLLADGATALFECSGRDCGRSNVWANQILGYAVLVGLDHDQYYLGALRDEGPHGELLSAYVVRRGNNQVYAHIEHIELAESMMLDVTAARVQDLQQRGFARIASMPYDMRGGLPASVRDQLVPYGDSLDGIPPGEVHLVCHVYGGDPVPELVERATVCADEALAIVDPELRLQIQTHGIGPLAPRDGRPESRIELIMPHRLERR